MMIAARSALDVEPSSYSSIHQHQSTNFCINNSESPPTLDSDINCNMSFPFISNGGEQSSPSFRASFENDYDGSRDRLSSSEDERRVLSRNLINDGIIQGTLSIHPPGSRLQFDRFSTDTIQRSPSICFSVSSPKEKKQSYVDFNTSPLKSNTCHKRLLSEDLGPKTKTNHLIPNPPSFDDDDDENSWKVCGVCNDKATGYHFNAMTCEGCKGFFRRSMKSGKAFTCSYNNECNITKSNRRQCQACRLRKCLDIGMKRECIMSEDQIQQKKSLVLTNRIKRNIQLWTPLEMSPDQINLLNTISSAFKESNEPPDTSELRGGEVIEKDTVHKDPSSPSPESNCFADLLEMMSSQLASQTPKAMTNEAHVLHFTDIMEYSIKQVIKFCKKVPTFMSLDVPDQIALLKSGCTEVMFLKANYTYNIEKKALTLGPKILYTRESFLQGGMSDEYTDAYLKFHEDLKVLCLDDTEMASLSAIAVFSADRSDVTTPSMVDIQQQEIAFALNAYTDSSYKRRNRFACIMSFLPRLRRLNSLCTQAFSQVQKKYEREIKPLVIETQPDTDSES